VTTTGYNAQTTARIANSRTTGLPAGARAGSGNGNVTSVTRFYNMDGTVLTGRLPADRSNLIRRVDTVGTGNRQWIVPGKNGNAVTWSGKPGGTYESSDGQFGTFDYTKREWNFQPRIDYSKPENGPPQGVLTNAQT